MHDRTDYLMCPVCGYDCHATESSACPECGATLTRSLDSPNRLSLSHRQQVMLICSTLSLVAALSLGMVMHFARRHVVEIATSRSREFTRDMMSYSTELQNWWMRLQAGEDAGQLPAAPSAPTRVPRNYSAEHLLPALQDAAIFLIPVILAFPVGVVILWALAVQRPLPKVMMRIVGTLPYFFCGAILFFAVFGFIVFLR